MTTGPDLAQMTGTSPPKRQSVAFAVTSLILGLISVIPLPTFIVTAPLAIIFGALRLRRGSEGRGLAIAGFILGIIVITIWMLAAIIIRLRDHFYVIS